MCESEQSLMTSRHTFPLGVIIFRLKERKTISLIFLSVTQPTATRLFPFSHLVMMLSETQLKVERCKSIEHPEVQTVLDETSLWFL